MEEKKRQDSLIESVEMINDEDFMAFLPPPLAFTLPGCPSRSAQPALVEVDRQFKNLKNRRLIWALNRKRREIFITVSNCRTASMVWGLRWLFLGLCFYLLRRCLILILHFGYFSTFQYKPQEKWRFPNQERQNHKTLSQG